MADRKADARFYAAIQQATQASLGGTLNATAVVHDSGLVFQTAPALLSYQKYLTQARLQKSTQSSVPANFEREVQVHATTALSQVHDMAAAALRTTRAAKQAGGLGRALDAWTAGINVSGPVRVEDVWRDLANDPSTLSIVKGQGVTDEVWAVVTENMNKVSGRFFLQNGKLAGEVRTSDQAQLLSAVFTHSPTGPARTVSDLLHRGQFDSLVDQFGQPNALPLDLAVGPPRDLEIPDVVMAGAILSVRSLAQHKRKLEDTGLAMVAGSDPLSVIVIAALVSVFVGMVLSLYTCPTNFGKDHGTVNQTACEVGLILMVLAALVLAAIIGPLGLVFGVPVVIYVGTALNEIMTSA